MVIVLVVVSKSSIQNPAFCVSAGSSFWPREWHGGSKDANRWNSFNHYLNYIYEVYLVHSTRPNSCPFSILFMSVAANQPQRLGFCPNIWRAAGHSNLSKRKLQHVEQQWATRSQAKTASFNTPPDVTRGKEGKQEWTYCMGFFCK